MIVETLRFVSSKAELEGAQASIGRTAMAHIGAARSNLPPLRLDYDS